MTSTNYNNDLTYHINFLLIVINQNDEENVLVN